MRSEEDRLRQQAELSQSIPPRGLADVFNPRWSDVREGKWAFLVALPAIVGAVLGIFGAEGAVVIVGLAVALLGPLAVALVLARHEYRAARERSRAGTPRTAGDRARSSAGADRRGG